VPRLLAARAHAKPSSALALAATAIVALSAAAPAGASEASKILEACGEGKVPSGYSQQAYEQALKQMPPYVAEYSPCTDLIHKAQLAAAAGRGGPGAGAGGSGGAGETGTAGGIPVAPPTPAEQHTLESVSHSGSTPVEVGSEAIHPGVVHADIASAVSALPTPLLALLAFLLACALLIFGATIRNHVRARRSSG
jgi:hypothetical protein